MNRSCRKFASRHAASPRRGAFTLIESLVALGMIAVILPIVMQGISLSLSLSGEARHRTQAASLARMKLDELVVTHQWNAGQLRGDFGQDWPGYEWTASMQDWQSGAMTQLEVTVTWTARARRQSLAVATLVDSEGQ